MNKNVSTDLSLGMSLGRLPGAEVFQDDQCNASLNVYYVSRW